MLLSHSFQHNKKDFLLLGLVNWYCFYGFVLPFHAMQPNWSRKKVYFDFKKELDWVVDRVKPWFMVHGLAHGS